MLLNSDADHNEEREPHLIDSAFSLVTDEFFKTAYNEITKDELMEMDRNRRNDNRYITISYLGSGSKMDKMNTSLNTSKRDLELSLLQDSNNQHQRSMSRNNP